MVLILGAAITIGEILDHRKIRRPKRHKHPQPDAGCVQGIAESSGYCGLCQTNGVVVERKIGDEDAERKPAFTKHVAGQPVHCLVDCHIHKLLGPSPHYM